MKILFIYPKFPRTFWSFTHALKFIGKKATNPPLGLITVAAMLPPDWQKKLVDTNVSKLSDRDILWADLVFISGMSVQKPSAGEIIARCKKLGRVVVAGGPLFQYESEKFPLVDHFVFNEAEITLPLFLADLAAGNPRRVYSTAAFPDITVSPNPLWHLLDMAKYDAMSVQFSRGCPFNCDFCGVTAMLGHVPRVKTTSQLVSELESLYQLGWRRNIFIVDDNFIGNKRILKDEVLPALIEWRRDKQGCGFITECSINLADDDELLDLMVQAGFRSVFIGIETPSEAGLLECHKSQNCRRNLLDSVHKLQRAGLQVMGGFIVGFDSDTQDIFQTQFDFIQQSGILTAMMGLLQAFPGTALYRRLETEGRLTPDISGNNTDISTNVIFKQGNRMIEDGFQRLIQRLYSAENFYNRVQTFLDHFTILPIPGGLRLEEIGAFFRSIFLLGVLGRERRQYWHLFWRTLFRSPRKFQTAITMAIYGHHFRKLSQAVKPRVVEKKSKTPRELSFPVIALPAARKDDYARNPLK